MLRFPGLITRCFHRWGTMWTSHVLCSSCPVGPACPVLSCRGFAWSAQVSHLWASVLRRYWLGLVPVPHVCEVLSQRSVSFLPALQLSFENGPVFDFVLGGWLSQPPILLPEEVTSLLLQKDTGAQVSEQPLHGAPSTGSGSPALGKPCLGLVVLRGRLSNFFGCNLQ